MPRVSFYMRRRWGPILWVWGVALSCALALLWWADVMPAVADLLRPFYIFIAIVVAAVTWRWFRGRSGDQERRRADRRHADRRGATDPDGDAR